MNERIKELMEEAGIYDFVVESMGINEEMEKFAELIVKECADMVDRAISDGGVDGRFLKEHFGVAE
jgi:hypothetical protein